ncbi:ABC transporter permease [Komagataeibacter rhaeticus]|nr:ABC transporter permease [Komagataeibacter rhaeticus]
MALDIPAGFARDMEAGRRPEIGVIIDGAVPFLAANVRAYATGVLAGYATTLGRELPRQAALPITVEPRFSYNQESRSIYAMTPGVIMLALILIPTMLTALGVVREKEVGSIVNLYASPASVGQYLMGKQAPYVALATLSYFMLVLVAVVVLGCRSRVAAGADNRRRAVRTLGHGAGPADLDLCQFTGGGHLRHVHPVPDPGGQLLRPALSGLHPYGGQPPCGAGLSCGVSTS